MVVLLHRRDQQLQVMSIKVFLKQVEFTESSFFLKCQLEIWGDGTVVGVISKKIRWAVCSQNKVLNQ